MTREEAIEVIEQDIPCEYDTDLIEALNMAINALEHPERNVVTVVPCGDTISRQAVIDVIEREQFKGDAVSEIEKLPSVTLERPNVNDVLDKIRAEIEQLHHHPKLDFINTDKVVDMAIEIIDKYRPESEG